MMNDQVNQPKLLNANPFSSINSHDDPNPDEPYFYPLSPSIKSQDFQSYMSKDKIPNSQNWQFRPNSQSKSNSQQNPPNSQQNPPNSKQSPPNSQQNPPNSKQNPLNSKQNPPNSQQNPSNSQQNPSNSQQNPSNSQQNPSNSQQDQLNPQQKHQIYENQHQILQSQQIQSDSSISSRALSECFVPEPDDDPVFVEFCRLFAPSILKNAPMIAHTRLRALLLELFANSPSWMYGALMLPRASFPLADQQCQRFGARCTDTKQKRKEQQKQVHIIGCSGDLNDSSGSCCGEPIAPLLPQMEGNEQEYYSDYYYSDDDDKK